MSVRRRAVRERVMRTRKLEAELAETQRTLGNLAKLIETKIAVGEQAISADEINQCFALPTPEKP